MTMNDFFKSYEIVVEQDGGQGVALTNMPLFQSHPEFNGPVHVFRIGEQDAFMSIESIAKDSLVRAIKNFKMGASLNHVQ